VCRHRSTSSLEKPCGAFLLYGDRVYVYLRERNQKRGQYKGSLSSLIPKNIKLEVYFCDEYFF